MTAGLWFSVVFFCIETFSRNVLNFISQKPNFRNFKTYLSIEMSLNVAGQMTEVSNSTKQKVNIPKKHIQNNLVNVQIS